MRFRPISIFVSLSILRPTEPNAQGAYKTVSPHSTTAAAVVCRTL